MQSLITSLNEKCDRPDRYETYKSRPHLYSLRGTVVPFRVLISKDK